MEKEPNTYCTICGKKYYVCMSCEENRALNPWKAYTDTAEHYKIFQVVKGYNTGVFDKKEANKRLSNIDLSDLEDLRDNIKETIKMIMKTNEEPKVNTVTEVKVKQKAKSFKK